MSVGINGMGRIGRLPLGAAMGVAHQPADDLRKAIRLDGVAVRQIWASRHCLSAQSPSFTGLAPASRNICTYAKSSLPSVIFHPASGIVKVVTPKGCWLISRVASRLILACAYRPTTALGWSACCAIARAHPLPWTVCAKRETIWCTVAHSSAASQAVTSATPRWMNYTSRR